MVQQKLNENLRSCQKKAMKKVICSAQKNSYINNKMNLKHTSFATIKKVGVKKARKRYVPLVFTTQRKWLS